MSVQFCLNPQTFTELKVDCRNSENYQKLETLLNKFQYLDLFVKNERNLCYRISNFAVKALEHGKLPPDTVNKVMAQFFAADVFRVPAEKEKCCLISKTSDPIGFNKTLLRFFCKKFSQSIQTGEIQFKSDYSTIVINHLKNYFHSRKLHDNLSLAVATELYSLALSYDFAELAVECEKTIHSRMKNEIKTQRDLETILQQVVLTEKTAVIEKLALKAFLSNNSNAINYKETDQTLALDASCMHLLLEEDILGRLLRNQVNGIALHSANMQDAAFLLFRISQEAKERITHLTFENPKRTFYTALLRDGYFAGEFPNVESVSLYLQRNDSYEFEASDLSLIITDFSVFKKLSHFNINGPEKVVVNFFNRKEWEDITNFPPIFSPKLELTMARKDFFHPDDSKENFLKNSRAFSHFQNIIFHASYSNQITYTCTKSVFQTK